MSFVFYFHIQPTELKEANMLTREKSFIKKSWLQNNESEQNGLSVKIIFLQVCFQENPAQPSRKPPHCSYLASSPRTAQCAHQLQVVSRPKVFLLGISCYSLFTSYELTPEHSPIHLMSLTYHSGHGKKVLSSSFHSGRK